jgi:phosphoserine phosphatase RsbU/P
MGFLVGWLVKLPLSIRGKSFVALLLASVIAMLVMGTAAWLAVGAIEKHYSASFTRNYSLASKQRIVAPVNRELALALRLASSSITREWVKDESNPQKRALFFREAEGYRADFLGKSLFVVTADSLNYYFLDANSPSIGEARYKINPQDAKDQWFFRTLKSKETYEINVSPDVNLGLTKVWLNFLVKNGERNIAVAGTGINLGAFIESFIQNTEPGLTTMALDHRGAIQAHKDTEKIEYESTTSTGSEAKTLGMLLKTEQERAKLLDAMNTARNNPNVASEFIGTLDKKRHMIAVTWSPELKWFVVAAADLNVMQFIDLSMFAPLLAAAFGLFALTVAGFASALNSLILTPITQLTQAATQIASGNLHSRLPEPRSDEVGKLTIAFSQMAEKVASHRSLLEKAVDERTSELLSANHALALISEKDELTGLGNRRMLLSRLKMQDTDGRKPPERGELTLALLDIDHFKHINDTYGHEAGDAVLVKLAQTIREQVRSTDIVGRWGGEEFLMILPGSAIEDSKQVMQRLLESIASMPIEYGPHILHIKASIGLARLKPSETVHALIQRADQALYEAKDTGRNRLVLAEI